MYSIKRAFNIYFLPVPLRDNDLRSKAHRRYIHGMHRTFWSIIERHVCNLQVHECAQLSFYTVYTSFLSSSLSLEAFLSAPFLSVILLHISYSIIFVHINSSMWIFHYNVYLFYSSFFFLLSFYFKWSCQCVREGENVKILTWRARSFSNVPVAATSDDSFSYHRRLYPALFLSSLSFLPCFPSFLSFFLPIYMMFYVIRPLS